LCQLNDPSGANFTTKIFGLGMPNGSVVKLSVIPTTYELPSAALATPSATSLPTPPHVVSVRSVWLWTLPIARAIDKIIKKKAFMVLRYVSVFSFLSPTSGGKTNQRKVTKLLLLPSTLLLRLAIVSQPRCLR